MDKKQFIPIFQNDDGKGSKIWYTSKLLDDKYGFDLVDIIKQRQQINNDIPKAYFCISRKIANTTLSKDVLVALKDYGFPVMCASTSQRIVYPKSAAEGKSIFDQPKNHEAIEEITAILEEIKTII
jgi:chromosome partitioning protein